MKIRNSNFVVTGGNRGIGLSVAQMAASKGAQVYIAARSCEESVLEDLRHRGAQGAHFICCDLGTREGVEALSKRLLDIEVDILFNNAGLLTGGLLEEQGLDEIYRMLQVNLSAVIHLSRAVLPGMIDRKRGQIVNNASVSAFLHFPCSSTYAAAKSAVVAFTQCLQAELVGTGVLALCLVTPGIKTRMFDQIPKTYGRHFRLSLTSISSDEFAEQVGQAIEAQATHLWPKGRTRVAVWLARFVNPVFVWVIGRVFHRNPI